MISLRTDMNCSLEEYMHWTDIFNFNIAVRRYDHCPTWVAFFRECQQ